MHTFELFIEDDRYTVPTLEFVMVRDVARARELASERMFASSHHTGIEVRHCGRRLFQMSRPNGRDDAQAHAS
jgi:hypothetical protein